MSAFGTRFVAVVLTVVMLASGYPGDAAVATSNEPVTVNVGSASRSVLPTVNGNRDYLTSVPDPFEPFDPGVFVPQWDQGPVAVGNGANESHWVRDDLRVTAMAIEAPDSESIVVLVAADLYMLLENDLDVLRAQVTARPELASVADRLEIVVGVTHTHHGPDPISLDPDRQVNQMWFDLMLSEMSDAISDAVTTRTPATLVSATGQHWFGAANFRDPRVIDPSMNVLQAIATNGEVIATAVQWTGHPEMTLGMRPEIEGKLDLTAQCAAAALPLDPCTAAGRYFTADYPGQMRQHITERVGGEFLYFIGALGGMVSPHRTIWPATDVTGLGDHYTPPVGAVLPGTGTTTARDFARAAIIGDMAGAAALEILAEVGTPLTDATVDVRHETFVTRLTNMGFRVLLRTDDDGRPFLGNSVTPLLNCPDAPADLTTCVDDGGEMVSDELVTDLLGVKIRKGDFVSPSITHVRLGRIGMLFVPGELQPHLVAGLPADFGPSYYDPSSAERHTPASQLTIPGYLMALSTDAEPWFVGIAQGALGYVMPIDDWRVLCIADELLAGACQVLKALGHIDYPDALSGARCKQITENPATLESVPEGQLRLAVDYSCRYGQALGQARGHYEETNAVGWDIAADLHAAVQRLLGTTSSAQRNPSFVGYWQGKRGIPPSRPGGLTVTPNADGATVGWKAVAGAVSYRVEVFPSGEVIYLPPSQRTHTITGADAGQVVGLRVSARAADWLRSPAVASTAVVVGLPPAGFDDIPVGRWFGPAVDWARDANITTGISGTNNFAPSRAITRAEIVTMLWRQAGRPEPEAPAAFDDVPPGTFYSDAVAWAAEQGITTGIKGTNNFAPMRNTTRAEIVTLLWRAAGRPEPLTPPPFVDVPDGVFFADAATWALRTDITSGVGDGSRFEPGRNASRAETITFFYRAIVGKGDT